MDHPPAPARTERDSPVTVWFDGACPLCTREIALMRRLDRAGRIAFVDLAASCTGDDGLPDRAALLARFHVREGDTVLSGAAAFAAMWRAIPALRWLGRAAQWPPLGALLEAGYRGFLTVRPLLQRLARRLAA